MSILGTMSYEQAQDHLDYIAHLGLKTWMHEHDLDPEKLSLAMGGSRNLAYTWIARGNQPSAGGRMDILNALMAGKVQQAEEPKS